MPKAYQPTADTMSTFVNVHPAILEATCGVHQTLLALKIWFTDQRLLKFLKMLGCHWSHTLVENSASAGNQTSYASHSTRSKQRALNHMIMGQSFCWSIVNTILVFILVLVDSCKLFPALTKFVKRKYALYEHNWHILCIVISLIYCCEVGFVCTRNMRPFKRTGICAWE